MKDFKKLALILLTMFGSSSDQCYGAKKSYKKHHKKHSISFVSSLRRHLREMSGDE